MHNDGDVCSGCHTPVTVRDGCDWDNETDLCDSCVQDAYARLRDEKAILSERVSALEKKELEVEIASLRAQLAEMKEQWNQQARYWNIQTLKDEARGRAAGLKEAAEMLVKRGRAYAEDSVLRHPGVILESFAIQVLALIPASECIPIRKQLKK